MTRWIILVTLLGGCEKKPTRVQAEDARVEPPPVQVDARVMRPMAVRWTLTIQFGEEEMRGGKPVKYKYKILEKVERSVDFTLREGPLREGDQVAIPLELGSRNLRACLLVKTAQLDPPILEARLHGGWFGTLGNEGETGLLDRGVTLGDHELRKTHTGGDWGWKYQKLETTSLSLAPTAPASAVEARWVSAAEAAKCVHSLPEVTLTGVGSKDYKSLERRP